MIQNAKRTSLIHMGYNIRMQKNEKVIIVKDLKKEYKDIQALRGVSFEVHRNEIFGILGPNGAGKTTTLEIIEGLKQQNSGSCNVLGLDNLTQSALIKKRIGVQLQSSEYLNYLSLEELLVLFASLYKEKIDPIELLKHVGLEDRGKSVVKSLSGGQKQRFTIATALVHKPEILFLDEPTTGLDPQARREMWDFIKELNKQNITIVMTTHYMEEAEYLCNRVAIMDSGKILKMDSPEGLIASLNRLYKLSFFVEEPMPKDFFDQFKSVENLKEEYPKVTLDLGDIEELPGIVQKLKSSNIEYKFLNLKTAKLEDVYLHLTGHAYSEE